ncbi:MAG: hypothetical protein AB7G13_06655 [Lautropia sp.]
MLNGWRGGDAPVVDTATRHANMARQHHGPMTHRPMTGEPTLEIFNRNGPIDPLKSLPERLSGLHGRRIRVR